MTWNLKKINEKIDFIYKNRNVVPLKKNVLRPFEIPPNKVRVVIIGQDPYPTPGVANGRAFAVELDQKIPASLRNIFKEIQSTFGEVRTKKDLQLWADQGVMLVNKNLTTVIGKPNYHDKIWEDSVIKELARIAHIYKDIIWVLWGKTAQSIIKFLPKDVYLIKDAHPSPLSFYRRNHSTFKEINKKYKIKW